MIFEEEVALALSNASYEVHSKVGSAEYSLDLAVVDPGNPGAYVMGIHCDGPEYNRAVTARDRDRLRREVLQRLGWKVYYLWSTEWFADPDKELEKLIEAISSVCPGCGLSSEANEGKCEHCGFNFGDSDSRMEEVVAKMGVVDREKGEGKRIDAVQYPKYVEAAPRISLGGKKLTAIDEAQLAQWVAGVVVDEWPVHISEVQERILSASGKRPGPQNNRAVQKGVECAVANGLVARIEDFLLIPIDTSSPTPVSRCMECGMIHDADHSGQCISCGEEGTLRTVCSKHLGENVRLTNMCLACEKEKSVPIRDRKDLPADKRKFDLVSNQELEATIMEVVRRSYGVYCEDIAKPVSRMLGFGINRKPMRNRIDDCVAELLVKGSLVDRHGQIQENTHMAAREPRRGNQE